MSFEFKLNFPLPSLNREIACGSDVVLFGSCFSDEMKPQFEHSGFRVTSNPFGTIYHPMAIHALMNSALFPMKEHKVHARDGLFFSWDASEKMYGKTMMELVDKMKDTSLELNNKLTSSSLLVITFGTAWAYHWKADNYLVANCHKAPSHLFDRNLTSAPSMIESWKTLCAQLLALNPKLNIVLTVSPVRHSKEGLIENNRSKARLIELVHALTGDRVFYFPAYEIVIDELRDYRFYKRDLVHPNATATEYVWDAFKRFVFDSETLNVLGTIAQLKNELSHRSLLPESEADARRQSVLMDKIAAFKSRYPSVEF